MATTTVNIDCDACVRLIKMERGVKSVSVSGKTAKVEYDDTVTNDQKIKQAVKK